MFTLSASSTDYSRTYKGNLLYFLRNNLRKEVSGNKEFEELFSMIDEIEEALNNVNTKFNLMDDKYKLLFNLRDFENLLKDKDFKKEILLYIEYKGKSKWSTMFCKIQ